jgi:hypothetical protein
VRMAWDVCFVMYCRLVDFGDAPRAQILHVDLGNPDVLRCVLCIAERQSFASLSRCGFSGQITITPAGWCSKMVQFNDGEEGEILFSHQLSAFRRCCG